MNRTILRHLPLLLLLSGCGGGSDPDYIKFAGGGIQFNYRYSEASMVAIAQQTQPLPPGSKLQALFDLPGTATRETVELPAVDGKLSYRFQSQELHNIAKDGHYNVTLLVLDAGGKQLDRKDRVYVSDQDQSSLPDKPLVGDIAFTPNPDALAK